MTVAPPEAERVHFPALDTLRLVGALAVLTTHVAFNAGVYVGHGVGGTLLSRLDVGVALFFVLSGFLLSRPWLAAAAYDGPRPRTATYLWRRALRILPVYVVTVVLVLAVLPQNRDLTLGERASTLLMLDVFLHGELPPGLSHMWSLAVEVTFYLLLPLLMLAAVGRSRSLSPRRVVVVLLAMTAVSVWWHLRGTDLVVAAGAPGLPALWLPGYLTWFAAGIALALVHQLRRQGHPSRLAAAVEALGRQPGVCWALAAGVMMLAATPLAGPSLLVLPTAGESTTKHLLYAAVGVLVVLPGVVMGAAAPGRAGRLWSLPLLRHLGLTSYSLFCLHMMVLYLVMDLTGWALFEGRLLPMWLLTAAVSLLVAEVAYRLVERPAQRLRRRAPGARSDASSSTATTATRVA